MRSIGNIVVHCSYTKINMDIGADEIKKWHTSPPNNWKDIGYHYVIRRDGILEYGRNVKDVGAHVKGYNLDSIGICLAGGMSSDDRPECNFTGQQFYTLRNVIVTLLNVFTNSAVLGHNDFPGVSKACPCFAVSEWFHKNKIIPRLG